MHFPSRNFTKIWNAPVGNDGDEIIAGVGVIPTRKAGGGDAIFTLEALHSYLLKGERMKALVQFFVARLSDFVIFILYEKWDGLNRNKLDCQVYYPGYPVKFTKRG